MNAETPSQPPFTIQLFGTLHLSSSETALPRPRNRRAAWILALLALRGGDVRREWLAAVLWPESLPAQAAYNLRRNLSELRTVLGDHAHCLESPTQQTLCLNTANADIDVHRFTAHTRHGTPADMEAALACYRADLLEDCELEWVATERHRLYASYLDTLEKLAAHYADTHDWNRAVILLRQLIAREPARESAHCRLMETLAAQGNGGEVTQVYRALRLYLHEELRTAPAPETDALHTRLKAVPFVKPPSPESLRSTPPDTRHPIPALSTLPNPLTQLLGREKDVQVLRACLRDCRLVTLKGPGGSGKIRLAISLGRQLSASFAGQVWFVSLAELPDAERLPAIVRDALRLPADTSGPFPQIVNRLATQPTLLILDNYEHLIMHGAGFVRELLAALPLLHCLVTSRHSLNLAGETEYRV